MALKRLSSVAETAPKASKDESALVKIPGRVVARFNASTAALKDAKADQEEQRAKLLQIGLKALFEYNVSHPTAPATTIKLLQENPKPEDAGADFEPIDGDGEVARLTFQNKYSACDADTADHLFESLLKDVNADRKKDERLSINNFMQETVTAAFDSKVFLTGDNGEFNQKIFDTYLAAIQKATDDLIKKKLLPEGTKVPLATSKKVLPLDNFHADRWTQFSDVEQQQELFEVVSNAVTITPVKSA
jgi:hypothetical protein